MDDLIDALAVFRITRLLVDDVIGDRPRAALSGWLEQRGHRQLAYLFTCPWCMSVWVAVLVVGVRHFRWWQPLARTLAASAITGLLADR